MRQHTLGPDGIKVSECCYGTLTLGPLQKNLPVKEGAALLNTAFDRGINFFDTADMYETYPYIHELLKNHPEAVICSRSYDYSAEGIRKRLHKALRAIGRDYIDFFLLHEQESRYTFEGHSEAFEELLKAKQEGKIRATGFSTHRIEAVRDSIGYPDLEVIFPLINKEGLGIEDGSRDEMLSAIKIANEAGKGIYTMKPLGGGNLIKKREECLNFQKGLLDSNLIRSVAIGMGSEAEIIYNTEFFNGREPSSKIVEKTLSQQRRLQIDDWCEKCGQCVKRCHQKALSLNNGKITVDRNKCLCCGYCAGVCPVFAIKVI